MAKNGPNNLIFGKLVIYNDFKRLMEDFLKILIFGCFFAFFGLKIARRYFFSNSVKSFGFLKAVVSFKTNLQIL